MDLTELYARAAETKIWLANDTSCGVGFAPLSDLERVVYQVEKYLNSSSVEEIDEVTTAYCYLVTAILILKP